MATQPFPDSYTPRELRCSRYVAAALWLLSAALGVLLVAWSIGPRWTA